MLQKIKDYISSRTITTHSIVAGFTTLVLLYAAVPGFRDLVNHVYSLTPSWFHEVAVAAFGIWAFYHPSKG